MMAPQLAMSTQILASKYYFPLRGTGLLKEMGDFKGWVENIQDGPGTLKYLAPESKNVLKD